MLNVLENRQQYPALERKINGLPIHYFDNAATGLKPLRVIEAVSNCFVSGFGNVGRGVHRLAEDAQQAYDRARLVVADFINADPDEIVFTSGATSAINLVANSLPDGSRILTSIGEHHSNLLAWQARHSCNLAGVLPNGMLDVESWQSSLFSHAPELCALHWISNVSGAIQPVDELVRMARHAGALTLVDASQAVGHIRCDVQELGCDLLCFSGHKLGAPSGVGVLYVRRQVASRMKPLHFGGGMVESVQAEQFELAELPHRFEAGTPPLEAAIGLAAACEYLSELGLENIQAHEHLLTSTAMELIASNKRLRLVGPEAGRPRAAIVSFLAEGLEAHGLARLLSSRYNIMVRSGFQCAQPLHASLDWRPTVRASFAHFNTLEEVNQLNQALRTILS